MKIKSLRNTAISVIAVICMPACLLGQNFSSTAQIKSDVLVSNSERQPFYFWANQLGQVSSLGQFQFITHFSADANYQFPQRAESIFSRINFNIKQSQKTTINLPELCLGLQTKYFIITAGLYADTIRMSGLSPTNSNFYITQNAAPYARLRLGSNKFIRIGKSNIFFAALYEEGILNDNRIVSNPHLHHKYLYVKKGNPNKLEVTFGLDHFIFWGGHTASIDYTPTLKEYIKTILGGKYFDNNLGFLNTIGNHLGQYQLKFQKNFQKANTSFQISHIFEDGSGMNLLNYPDNIYTIFLELKNSQLVNKVLVEYTYTKHQSGPAIDPKTGEYRPVSGDNYFSHSQYRSGFTHKGFFIGNPLFGPLRYTEEGIPNGPANNMFSAIHIGMSGELFSLIDYKLMITHSVNYGRNTALYVPSRNQLSTLAAFKYSFSKPSNLFAELQLGFDRGSLWSGNVKNEYGANVKLGYLLK